MPVDTKRPAANNNAKPITPRAPIRSKSGPYLTPKLATATRTVTSGDIGRDGQVVGNTSNVNVIDKDNITTPVKSFLATNITPRSSSRKSRTNSASSTPISTDGYIPVDPNPGSISVAFEEGQQESNQRGGFETTWSTTHDLIMNGASPSSGLDNGSPDANNLRSLTEDSSLFFHANDAISIPKKPFTSNARPAGGFVYADGRREEPISLPNSRVGSRPTSQVITQHRMYSPSSGQSDASQVVRQSQPSLGPTISPKLPYSTRSQNFYASRPRSTSPLKEFDVPSQQEYNMTRRPSGASVVSLKSATKSMVSTIPLQPFQHSSSQENRAHFKTQSMSSLGDPCIPTKAPAPHEPVLSAVQSPRSIKDLPISPSFFNIKTGQFGSPMTPLSPVASPDRLTAPGVENTLDHLNSLAANARTERKVLDLEISNSSLLAINRTLEREMRKQKAELRRYRRLTSGGRLSLLPKGRAVSGATTISTLSFDSDLGSNSDGNSSLTDILSEDEDEDLGDSDDDDSILPPDARAERDLRQRERDEKRLQLDLSKHQQLLIDSQKMNESLRRCLAWTEELIVEGKKAIDYRVHAGEIKLGGRILHQEDNPEMQDVQPRHGLLSPTITGNPANVLWSSQASASEMSDFADKSHTSAMADEGKEFREYLDSLEDSIVRS